MVLISGQIDHPQLHFDDHIHGGRGHVSASHERQGHIFRQTHGTDECAGLEKHADGPPEMIQGDLIICGDVNAFNRNSTRCGFVKSNHVF